MEQQDREWLAIAWAPYSRMSDTFARELGGKLYCVHYLRFQSPPHAPLKYLLQAVTTVRILASERPRAIHVQTPPFVCALVVYLYCTLFGGRYVLHYHSAAFGRIWDWALPVQRFLARHAVTNIVTNQHWAGIVRSWGAHALIMIDPFLDLPDGAPFRRDENFSVAFVNIFADDEPVEAVVDAARMLPDVHLYITGDTSRRPAEFIAAAPANVTFTGFLDPMEEYPGLLRAVDAVMVLTTRNYTLQLGGCEAVAVGKPLITSDWPYLREVFAKGTIFVSSTAESIRDGIRDMQATYDQRTSEIVALRGDSRQDWNKSLGQLRELTSSVK